MPPRVWLWRCIRQFVIDGSQWRGTSDSQQRRFSSSGLVDSIQYSIILGPFRSHESKVPARTKVRFSIRHQEGQAQRELNVHFPLTKFHYTLNPYTIMSCNAAH